MSDLSVAIISGVAGAVAGGLSGAVMGWLIAPTQAERVDRGRQRLEGRKAIATAVTQLNYQLTEARGRLLRVESTEDLLDQSHFVTFAGSVRSGAIALPALERWLIIHRPKALLGRLVWRLAVIVPSDHYSDIDEASLLKSNR